MYELLTQKICVRIMCVLYLYFQDTHCYSFRYLIEGLPSLSSSSSNVSESIGPSSQLNVYVLDHESGVQLMPVWSSGDGTVVRSKFKVQSPLVFQVRVLFYMFRI